MSEKLRLEDLPKEYFSELGDWNSHNAAFIKHDMFEGRPMWMIYGADGERIAVTDDRDFAFIVARQNDLEPYSAH